MSVPKLDLAPKLKRPLSLWNPLDYLRLLYWSIFFPQAFSWYLGKWAGGDIAPTLMNIKKRWQLRLSNPIRRNLLIQELIIIFCFPLLLYRLFIFFEPSAQEFALFLLIGSMTFGLLLNLISNIGLGITGTLGFAIGRCLGFVTKSVALGVAKSVALGVAYVVALGVALVVAEGVAEGVALGMAYVVALIVAEGVTFDVGLGVGFGVAYVVAFGVGFGVAYVVAEGITKFFVRGLTHKMIFSLAFGVALGMAFGVTYVVAEGVVLGVAFGVAFGVVSYNPGNWLISLIFNPTKSQDSAWKFPHVTLLPNFALMSQLHKWLQQDWEIGVHNINQILQYTFQSTHVVRPIKRALTKIPDEQVIYRVNQLVEGTNNWDLIRSLCAFRSKNTSFATINGFWYLHEKQPDKATEAFAVVRSLLYGEEVFILSQTLAIFQKAEEIRTIAKLKIPNFPTENLLRSTTWQTMNSLRRVVEDVKLIQQSASRVTKSLAYSRTIGELTAIIDNKANIPEAERELIVDIATNWKKSLERIGKEIGNVAITKPVRNPHIIGDPVTGSLFVGREDILRQLEELWITGNQLQSVVLYGHRRMGKTSILVNIANCTGAEIKVIYVNLQLLGAVSQGVAEVLMAISDEIATAFKIAPPDDDAFLKLPQRTFERYLKQVIADMSYRGLIIALDEFETIEELIQQGQIDPGFMGFLRGLVQMSPKIAFAFAGLHTLQEMTADYFQPFFASVIPIRVSFLNPGATKTILANPSSVIEENQNIFLNRNSNHQNSSENELEEEFLLDYTGEALDLIYSLTSGQPYLVQLIGFQLVRNYNDQVFEQGTSRDNIFTVKDVNKVVNETLFQQGRYYFEGVWGQAGQDVIGQQDIITALAPHPQGLTIKELTKTTELDDKTLTAAIEILERHDVIKESDRKYRIIVELFRRWALKVSV